MMNGMELYNGINNPEDKVPDDKQNGGKTREGVELDTSASTRGKNFGVKAELQLDYMSGAVHVEGSAEYVKDELTQDNVVRYTSYRIYQSHFNDINRNTVGTANGEYCKMMGSESGPTHFVSRINYGQRVFMTFETEYGLSDSSS